VPEKKRAVMDYHLPRLGASIGDIRAMATKGFNNVEASSNLTGAIRVLCVDELPIEA